MPGATATPDARKIVLLISPSGEYTRGLLSGIATYVQLHRNWVLCRPLEYREPRFRRRLPAVLKALHPDGILMREPPHMDEIVEMGVPIVSFPYTRATIAGVVNVVPDHIAVGQMAAEHLLDQIMTTGARTTQKLYVRSTRVVARLSSDVLAVDDPRVAAALRYIRQHGNESLGVPQVVANSGTSRRLLERRFRDALGRTIYDEIQRVRVGLVKTMLVGTHMLLKEIARELNCAGVPRVSRYFHKATGLSPMQYRKQFAR